MVIVEPAPTTGDRVKVKFAEERNITKFKITNEGEYVTYEPKEGSNDKAVRRFQIGVKYSGIKEGDPKTWGVNNKNLNALIDIFGTDTKQWIGHLVEISYAGDGEFRYIQVDAIRTKEKYVEKTKPAQSDDDDMD